MNLSSLIGLVTPYCPNVPDFVFEGAILECARDYFDKTKSWIVQGSLTAPAGTNLFTIDAPESNMVVVSIDSVELVDSGQQLEPVPQVNNFPVQSTPTCYALLRRDTIKLYPTPKSSTNLTINIAVKPTFAATEIDDQIFEDNAEAIKNGTIAILKRQVGTDWYDPEAANYFQRQYELGIGDKKLEMQTNFNPNALEIATPYQ